MLKLSSILRVFLLLLCFAGTVSLAALGGSEESIPPSSNSDERTDENFRKEREVMLEKHLRRRGISDPPVLEAMERVPRQDFVVDRYRIQAYADKPLPIGYGQTISQPYIVAYMTELLALKAGDRVLEIGTGSGYQAAVLAEITDEVFSIEIIEELTAQAEERLKRLGYQGVELKRGDGYYGWPEHAPFDGIIVTAAAGHIPPPLLEQLSRGGRMVIPIGGVYQVQTLMLVEKDEDGNIRSERLMPVRFVPFTGSEGR